MLASLGKNPTHEDLDAMMNEAQGSTNFAMFLTMFGEKLNVQIWKMSSETLLLTLMKQLAPFRRII